MFFHCVIRSIWVRACMCVYCLYFFSSKVDFSVFLGGNEDPLVSLIVDFIAG